MMTSFTIKTWDSKSWTIKWNLVILQQSFCNQKRNTVWDVSPMCAFSFVTCRFLIVLLSTYRTTAEKYCCSNNSVHVRECKIKAQQTFYQHCLHAVLHEMLALTFKASLLPLPEESSSMWTCRPVYCEIYKLFFFFLAVCCLPVFQLTDWIQVKSQNNVGYLRLSIKD